MLFRSVRAGYTSMVTSFHEAMEWLTAPILPEFGESVNRIPVPFKRMTGGGNEPVDFVFFIEGYTTV